MSLPLPKVVADVGPGGGLVTAMGGINALSDAMAKRQIDQANAQYAPLTNYANIANKMALARFIGPNFLASIMGNKDLVANMSEAQKAAATQVLAQAGLGQQGNALANNQLPSGTGQPSTNAFSATIKNQLSNAFNQTPNGAAPQSVNPMASMGNNPQNPANNGQQNRNASLAQIAQYYKSPQGQAEMAKEGYPNGYPPANQLTMNPAQPAVGNAPATWAQNVANQKKIEAQGAASGGINAQNINDLNKNIFNANTTLGNLHQLNGILASPEFARIRNVPLSGHHEIEYYSKEGTPAQQQMVGKYIALTGNIIKNASRDFAGQFRTGEQALLEGMKPNPSDTVDTGKGKAEALTTLTTMLRDRANLTKQYMQQYQVDQGTAENLADKQVNGDQIRQRIDDQLNPTINIKNNKTGEKRTISVAEARKLGVPNV